MEAAEIPLEKRYQALCNILRAQHFAWREALRSELPEQPVAELVRTMWEVAGRVTADAFCPALDATRPLPPQLARAVSRSWLCTGQRSSVEISEGGEEAWVTQAGCPWFAWNARHDALAEDRAGCDAWFAGLVERVNERTGARVAVESCSSLPDGDSRCRRRFYVSGRLLGFQDW